jgi:hypothetical protein
MSYEQKAVEILNSSINSAVFIDEQAKDFFSGTEINTEIVEEKLSLNLFNTFKENGKSLIVHKFEKENVNNTTLVNYLFSGRDLILLDWELDKEDGQQYSLDLLSKAINLPYLNFCCIYSRSKNFDKIPYFLTAYFSGLKKEELESIQEKFSYLTKEDIDKFNGNPDNSFDDFFHENEINIEDFPIEKFKNKSKKTILDIIYISLEVDKYFFKEDGYNDYEVIFSSENSFIINNTFVFTIKKDDDDSDYNYLIGRIAKEIIKNESSFFQLLGLEMQTIFNSNERFIDETILKSSTEALFQLRKHINDDNTFGIVIKKLLIEQATLKFRTAKLKLLDSDFLNQISEEITDPVTDEDLFQLNVFYNSVSVKSLNPIDIPNLNFGDILKDSDNNYYLCITALCDCYEPSKVQYNFYFVKGKPFKDSRMALKLGDAGFLSFLPNNVAIYWGDLESAKPEKIVQNQGEHIDQYRIRKLSNEIEAYKNFLYKPFYIKPKVYNIQNNKLIDNKIRMWDITNKFTQEEFDQNLNYFDVEYVTTLRNDYTQRIANHAFGHPARVGVDFVKPSLNI